MSSAPTNRRPTLDSCLLALLVALTVAGPARAAVAEPATVYRLDLSERRAQVLQVSAEFEGVIGRTLDVHLPIWRTGLYRRLDPVGTVSEFRAEAADGTALEVVQTAGSSWRVRRPDGAPGAVTVRYLVDALSLEDRTRDVDADHAFVNPGPVLVYADGYRDRPIEVRVDLPPAWRAATGLAQPEPGVLVAPDYDRLVDSPIELGTFDTVSLEAEGATVELAIHGTWDGDAARLAEDVRAIVDACTDVYGDLPVDRYVFLTHSAPGLGGGTEYWNSTVVHTEPEAFWDPDEYEDFLALLTHEFFHTWNVKRFRPAGIARYDYRAENYTELLWVAEGLTSYYDEMLLARAGLIDEDAYRERLAHNTDAVLDRPGYGRQSLARASFEAWTKGYHPGPDRTPIKANRTVSFYAQGGLLGLVLDLEIRAASANARSLDDVMRSLYRDFPLGSAGYTYADVRARVARAGGAELGERLDGWVLGTEPLPVAEALARVGWTLQRERRDPDDGDPAVTLGVATADGDGGQRVRRVDLDGPAWRAGLNVGDVLIALDGERLGDDPDPVLVRHAPGDTVTIAYFRDGRLREAALTLGTARADHELVPDPDAPDAARELRRGWLGTGS
jgi:predicted metalloprotease with PDZ domain